MNRAHKLRRSLSQASTILAFLISPVAAQDLGELDCVIEPHTVIDLSSRVDGIVETLEVQRGELIEQDQILVHLEAGVERASVAEAQARAAASAEILAGKASSEFAKRREGRLQELHSSQAVSLDQLDEMTTESELSRLELQQARENKQIADLQLRQAREVLKRHTIRSPIRGIVVERYLAPGESVKDVPIMRLAEIDPLRVEVIVPVAAFGSIKVGQPAVVRPEAPMVGEYPAKVTVVDGVADAASGTYRVRLGLPNEDYAVPSGLKCRVQFLPYEELPETQMAESEAEAPESESDSPELQMAESEAEALESENDSPELQMAASEAEAPESENDSPDLQMAASEAESPEPESDSPDLQMAASEAESPEPEGDAPDTQSAGTDAESPMPIVVAKADTDGIVKTAATPANSATERCQTIGPLKDKPQAERIMAAIAGQATQIDLREESLPPVNGYQILAPRQASLKDSRALTEEMQAFGFTDFYILNSGPRAGRISLGVYRDQQSAERTRVQLADLGFASELVPRSTPQSRFWLEVELLAPVAALDLTEAQQSFGGSSELTAASCDVVTGQK